jgi:hypothetical protein
VWIEQEQIDKWAFDYCYTVEDDPEVWSMIKGSKHAYIYCKYVKNRPEVRELITESEFAAFYCEDVSDDEDMETRITERPWRYYYYRFVEKNSSKAEKYAGKYPELLIRRGVVGRIIGERNA